MMRRGCTNFNVSLEPSAIGRRFFEAEFSGAPRSTHLENTVLDGVRARGES